MHDSVNFTAKHSKKQQSGMGPSRFERESEDPQSPRMARLPYGPAVILFAHIPYVPCCFKKERSRSLAPLKVSFGIQKSSASNVASRKFLEILRGTLTLPGIVSYVQKRKMIIAVAQKIERRSLYNFTGPIFYPFILPVLGGSKYPRVCRIAITPFPSLTDELCQKKRYVYKVSSGIMNYSG